MDTLAIILSLRLIASSENLGRVSNGYLTTPELLHSQEKYSTAMMPMFHPTEDPYMLGNGFQIRHMPSKDKINQVFL